MPATHQLPSSSPRSSESVDRQGLHLSTSPEAAALYREALAALHGSEAGVVELFDQAIAADRGFALAHAARWILAHADGDQAAVRVARESALASLKGVSARERSHVECIAALLQREPDAWNRARAHLAAYPLDLLIASQLVGDLFFHGGPGKRQAILDVLGPLAPQHRQDWAFLAMLGFHLSELGDPQGGIEALDAALRARPAAPFIAHAMTHALLESGRRAEAHRFLLDWSSRHDPAGRIDGHLHWHLSIGELEAGEAAAAVERYLRWSAPDASHCAAGLVLADAGGLFFRMALEGVPAEGMPRAALLALLERLQRALKIPFVAVHAAALAVALGDQDGVAYLQAMKSSLREGEKDPAALVVSAFKAYLAGDLRACVEALELDRPSAWEAIGGSNEERSLIERLHAKASQRLAAEGSA